jgi:hypothetical protein
VRSPSSSGVGGVLGGTRGAGAALLRGVAVTPVTATTSKATSMATPWLRALTAASAAGAAAPSTTTSRAVSARRWLTRTIYLCSSNHLPVRT